MYGQLYECYIHPTAEIEYGVTIGDHTKVWNQVQIRSGARIGQRCNIGKNVFIDAGVQIGNGVKIQNNVNVYHGVTVEDDVFLGPSMTFTNDMRPRAFNKEWEVTPTLVRRGASIGANATIRCGVTIGRYAMVGCGAVVTKDVEEFELVAGNPARHLGWVCKCGERVEHRGLSCEKCCKSHVPFGEEAL